ncbi:hypothetical protein OZZ93_11640 [Enterococcus sp. E4-152]|uniref:hypothetical protein n=1 Tax=Enterococcus TaxID=1350 RepID=UPI000330BE5C|nr:MULTISPECIES: hypothetical protein [Enterococcus]EOK66285.1 hypothetical protein SE5_02516 [Enterococcus faecium EnGen0125]MEB4777661.1 hypothetical protein [Enterococcus sp. E4-152]
MFEKELAELQRKAQEKALDEERMNNLGSLESDLIEQLYQDAIKSADVSRATAINRERKARRKKAEIEAKKAELARLQEELKDELKDESEEGEADE